MEALRTGFCFHPATAAKQQTQNGAEDHKPAVVEAPELIYQDSQQPSTL